MAQPVRVGTGGNYGDRKAQMEQQMGAEVAGEAIPAATFPSTNLIGGINAQQLPPVTSLPEPTQYPNQPVTDGGNAGPGAGASELPVQNSTNPQDNVALIARAIYAQYPTSQNRRIIEVLNRTNR
jgi:hypothetical protein